MARLHVMEQSKAQAIMTSMHELLEHRLSVSTLAPCPVEFAASYVSMCASQSCGKCTPCRVGLRMLSKLFDDILHNRATLETIDTIEATARNAYLSSDCAIGYETGEAVLLAVQAFRDDFEHHVKHHVCGFDQTRLVPCVTGCPANVDIPGYIALTKAGRYTDAIRLIRKDNPFPLACGYICEHPCEPHCRRGMVDDPMNIRGIKRYAVDHAGDYEPFKYPATGHRVAVIGGGPAGISCAYFLTLMGHEVTLFEQRKQLGGMLRYGIPSYRLPREELDREVDWLIKQGITVHLNHSVDGEEFERLRDEFDAVYVAIGAHSDKKLNIPGEDAEEVLSAVELLRAIGDDEIPSFKDETVVIIGGGNVAMDVARTSVRLGAKKIIVVYRRRIADMTAQDEEIADAQAEGCELLDLYAPAEVVVEGGHVVGLRATPQIIGAPRHGRPAPRQAEGEDILIPCDRVIVAIGQDIDSASFEKHGLECNRGRIVADDTGRVANMPGVYVGGDCQSGPATVIRAVNAGKVAAGNIDEYLGCNHAIGLEVDVPTAPFTGKVACARCELRMRDTEERSKDFDLVEAGFTDEEIAQEASRCLRCDHFGYGSFRGGRVAQW